MFLQLASYGLILFGVFLVLVVVFGSLWNIYLAIFGDPFEIVREKLGWAKSGAKDNTDLQMEMEKQKGEY